MRTPGAIDASQRRAARVAGLANLLGMATVVVAQYVLFGPLVVRGDAAATARNILAHERLFRLSIAFDLLYVVGVLVLIAALYVILKPVGPGLALLAAICRLAYALTWVALAMSLFAGVRLLGDSTSRNVFGAETVPAIARLYFGRGFEAYYVGLPFYAVASTVGSWLFLRSAYIPKALAVFGVVSSAWCVACAFLYIVSPDFGRAVNPYWFDSPMALYEMAASVWLLLRGLPTSGTPLRA
jgi:hypothetical protein